MIALTNRRSVPLLARNTVKPPAFRYSTKRRILKIRLFLFATRSRMTRAARAKPLKGANLPAASNDRRVPTSSAVLEARRHSKTSSVEFALLAALAKNAGRVLSRAQLLELAWPHDVAVAIEDDRTVDVHIRRIRRALGAGARRIETIPSVGYRLSDRYEAT